MSYNIKTFVVDTSTLDSLVSNLEILFHPLSATLYDMILITGITIPDYLISKYKLHSNHSLYYFADCGLSISDEFAHLCFDKDNWILRSVYSDNQGSAFALYYEWWMNQLDTSKIDKVITLHILNAYRDVVDSIGTWENVRNGDNVKYLINRCIHTLFEHLNPDKFKNIFTNILLLRIDEFKGNESKCTAVTEVIRQLSEKSQEYCDKVLSTMDTRTLEDKTFIYKEQPYKMSHVFGFVFSEEYSDMIGESMLAVYQEIDISVVISGNVMRFYSNNPDIDISEVISVLGGCGNRKRGIVKINDGDMSWINTARFNAMINRAGNVKIPVL